MYDQDTFFQLTTPGRTGLLLLSSGLVAIIICVTFKASNKLPRLNLSVDIIARLTVAVALFWLFLWLSPQVYYLYYRTIIDTLPWQNVISAPPSFQDIGQILLFQNANSLAEHSKAALGWVLIISAIIKTLWQRTGLTDEVT